MEHTETYAGIPAGRRRRWPRIVLILAGALVVLVGAGFATGLVKVYDAPASAGIVVGVECHNIGLEVRGTPGLFADSCS